MNCLKNKRLRLVCCICLAFFIVLCIFRWLHKGKEKPYKPGIYYGWQSTYYGYGLQYVILTKDSLYVNILQTRDSAWLNINRWRQPYNFGTYGNVMLDHFVPIGIQWVDMVCYLYRDSIGNIYGKDSTYIYEHGIEYESCSGDYYLFYDPDQDLYTFYKTSFENLQEKGIVPSKCKAIEDVEKYLCINDSSVFEGVRKMSKSELRTLLWGE